jgi:hypothetical protein
MLFSQEWHRIFQNFGQMYLGFFATVRTHDRGTVRIGSLVLFLLDPERLF